MVEGQSGTDTLLFNGANVNENIDISANGSRVRFSRDVANITMDVNGVETISFNAMGGTDTITVNDLIGNEPEPCCDRPGGTAAAEVTDSRTRSSSTGPTATT